MIPTRVWSPLHEPSRLDMDGRLLLPRTTHSRIRDAAPEVVEQHLTFGISKGIGQGKAINFALMRAFRKEIDGPNTLEAPGFQTIGLAMSQWEFDISFSFGF